MQRDLALDHLLDFKLPNFLESTFAVIPRIPRQHATKDSQGSTPTRIYQNGALFELRQRTRTWGALSSLAA